MEKRKQEKKDRTKVSSGLNLKTFVKRVVLRACHTMVNLQENRKEIAHNVTRKIALLLCDSSNKSE